MHVDDQPSEVAPRTESLVADRDGDVSMKNETGKLKVPAVSDDSATEDDDSDNADVNEEEEVEDDDDWFKVSSTTHDSTTTSMFITAGSSRSQVRRFFGFLQASHIDRHQPQVQDETQVLSKSSITPIVSDLVQETDYVKVKMGEDEDAMEYDRDFIFKHLCVPPLLLVGCMLSNFFLDVSISTLLKMQERTTCQSSQSMKLP